MTLTCSSVEWYVFGKRLAAAGIRAVQLTDVPAVFPGKAGDRLRHGGPTRPSVAGESVRDAALALLAMEWATVSFTMPEKAP